MKLGKNAEQRVKREYSISVLYVMVMGILLTMGMKFSAEIAVQLVK
nr:MAG TPA: hypothetical protein [Caudoviricetes sp.]